MDEKEELISAIEDTFGVVPDQARLILGMLAHPRVIDEAKRYLRARDLGSQCTKYKHPWSCIREAEAKFENVKYGWLGAGSAEIELDWCCANCMKRITEE